MEYKIPVSVKGIVFEDGKVWLRKNERNEWELPGGKVEKDEKPEQALERELNEELGFETRVIRKVHEDVYALNGKDILVVSYVCELLSRVGGFELDSEAGPAEFNKFPLEEITSLNMPQFYKDAILSCKS